MPDYALGALPPIEHPTAWRWGSSPLSAATRPAAFDALTGAAIPVKDQKSTGSCVGHATSELVEALHILAGETDTVLSAEMPWQLAKQIEGSLGQNAGIYPHDALDVTRKAGICIDRLMPLSETDFSELPNADAIRDAAARTGIVFRQCANREELLTAMGTLQVPGLVAIAVYAEFFDAAADGSIKPFSGAIQGYHALLCRGYDDAARTVRIRNSWGLGWGDHGDCVLTYDQLDACITEAWIAQLPDKPKPKPVPPKPDSFKVFLDSFLANVKVEDDNEPTNPAAAIQNFEQMIVLADRWVAYLKGKGNVL